MIATAERLEFNVLVDCPETGRPTRVWVEADAQEDPQLRGCSRYWGDLLCEGACEEEAVAQFRKTAERCPPVYCGRPNLASPRPREATSRAG